MPEIHADTPIELISSVDLATPCEGSFPFCVFLYAIQGEITVSLSGDEIPLLGSDLLFLPPGRPFSATAVDPGECQLLLLGISESFIADHLETRPLPLLASPLDPSRDYLPLKRQVLAVCAFVQGDASRAQGSDRKGDTSGDALRLRGTLYLLLAELRALLPARSIPNVPDRYARRVQEIADYIDLHCAESFSLSDLAGAFYLTPQYLSTFFREQFGTNFKSYLTEKRLSHSLRDLRNTDATISEIALRSGFTSVSAFQKNFQKFYGMTPSDFRAQHRRETAADYRTKSQPITASGNGSAAPSAAFTLRADAAPVSRPHVNRMINVGSAYALLSDRFRSRLLEFCRTAHIRYIRFEELLSSSFIPKILPREEYFYQNADTVLNFLYENGLTPFIELTKAGAVQGGNGRLGRETGCILRSERFFRLLESFLKHVARRYPASWLSAWKFELWMLPRDTADSYVSDLARTIDIVGSHIPGAAVGGPGYDAARHTVTEREILAAFSKMHPKPGFFSASLDFYVRGSKGEPAISPNPDCLTERCTSLRSAIAGSGLSLPLYITEWSSADPPSVPAAASLYQAAFIAKTYAALDGVSDLAAYWLYSDMEYAPGAARSPVWNFGRGLVGSSFVPYAAFFAYELCAGLGCEVLSEGSCFRLVRAEENHYQLLAFHYAHFRGLRDPAIRDAADFDQVYELFEDNGTLRFEARLTGLLPGLYHSTLTVIDRYHGSALDVLIGECAHSNIDRIDFLRYARMQSDFGRPHRASSSLPIVRGVFLRIDGTMMLDADLPPHAVCLWDIRRQI